MRNCLKSFFDALNRNNSIRTARINVDIPRHSSGKKSHRAITQERVWISDGFFSVAPCKNIVATLLKNIKNIRKNIQKKRGEKLTRWIDEIRAHLFRIRNNAYGGYAHSLNIILSARISHKPDRINTITNVIKLKNKKKHCTRNKIY